MRNTGMKQGSIFRHLKIHKKRVTAAVATILAVIVLLTGIPAMRAQAVFDTSNAVRFRTYRQSHTIEDSMLFIGTHLIHLQAMTDELYEKALQSQTDSEQENIYYKSELADGTWYDITEATGLSDITSTGVPVEDSELDDLYVTYYTGSDGITKSAKTDETVCIFDDPDPYDLLKLKELEIVREIRDQSYSDDEEGSEDGEQSSDSDTEENGSHKYIGEKLKNFFENDVKNDVTDACDSALKNLQKLYEAYCAAGMDEDAQVIMTLMESVDATRRAEVYRQLCQDGETKPVTIAGITFMVPDYSLLTDLSKTVSGEYYTESDPFILDSTLLDAVMTSIGECNTSYTSYSSKALTAGGSIINTYIYEQMNALNDLCGETDESGETTEISLTDEISSLVNNIKYAQNIQNGIVGNADAELLLLDEKFIPAVSDDYTKALQVGASEMYKSAVSANKSDTTKQSILKEDATDLEVARTALETMISAKKERMTPADAINYLYERITWTYEQKKDIPKDDFAVYAKQSAADHIEWLTELARKIVDNDASLMSELDRLKALLAEYLLKQQEALDDGNLQLAAQYGDLADDASARIAAEEARLNDILNSDTASEADKAAARVALGQTDLLNDINDRKNQAISAINNGETDGLQNMLDYLATLGGENALNDIKNALADSSLSSSDKDKWSKRLDTAIAASKDSSLHDSANATAVADGSGDGSGAGDGTGTGNGAGDGTGNGNGSGAGDGTGNGTGTGSGSSDTNPATMSESALLNAIEQILGGSFDELDAEGRIAASVALDRLYDNYSNVNAKKLAAQFITRCMSERNPYAYTQLSGHAETEYIPLSTIGTKPITSYRYVYSDSRQEATMTYGAKSYQFRVGAKVVGLSDGTEQEIKNYKVEFQNTPYIDEATSMTYFDCEAEYIINTKYAACLTKNVKEKADTLYKALTGQS